MLADSDPNYVGFHLVGPEDKESALDDYDLNMEMIGFVGSKFPRVHRALHAGEQTLGKAPPYALVDHPEERIEIAGAERNRPRRVDPVRGRRGWHSRTHGPRQYRRGD